MRVDFRLTGSVLSDFRNSSDGNELFGFCFVDEVNLSCTRDCLN